MHAEWVRMLRKYTKASKEKNDYMTFWQKLQLAAKAQHGEKGLGSSLCRADDRPVFRI